MNIIYQRREKTKFKGASPIDIELRTKPVSLSKALVDY